MEYTNFHVICKQNLDLAIDEVISVTKAYDPKLKVIEPAKTGSFQANYKKNQENLIIIKSKIPEWYISQKLALTKFSGIMVDSFSELFVGNEKRLQRPNNEPKSHTQKNSSRYNPVAICTESKSTNVSTINYNNSDANSPLCLVGEPSSFACKTADLYGTNDSTFNSKQTQELVGSIVNHLTGHKVSLANPEFVIYLIKTKNSYLVGYHHRTKQPNHHNNAIKNAKRNNALSDSSAAPKKVNVHPSQLDPKLARTMVNLSGLREGHTICDPFCGTGTILLEANFVGIKGIGIDYNKNMWKMALDNIRANNYSKKNKIINTNFENVIGQQEGRFDGIVTDLPYGIASKYSEKIDTLIEKFVSAVPKKKNFVIMCKKGNEYVIQNKLKPTRKYEIYRHKSLTRVILAS